MATGFLIKHPSCLVGYASLSASRFISPEDMKQTLTLISIANIFSNNSNPFTKFTIFSQPNVDKWILGSKESTNKYIGG